MTDREKRYADKRCHGEDGMLDGTCKKKAVNFCRDPYISDIDDDDTDTGNPEQWWCDDCLYEMEMNI